MSKNKIKSVFGVLLFILAVTALVAAGDYYRTFQKDNVSKPAVVKIYHTYSFDDLCKAVEESGAIENIKTFRRAAKHMDLAAGFKPGYYNLRDGMSNKELVRTFAYGWQSPVNLSFSGYIRTLERFSQILSEKLEADSSSFAAVLLDTTVMQKYGFEPESFIGMFIPNTYEVFWTITPEDFVERMNKEYVAFWTPERQAKAVAAGLTQKQVSTLAAIVIDETKHEPEMARIAGVYMNRLNKGMLLQADPTVKYALNMRGITRILNQHLTVDSPYNTYRYKGLPPGPITMPPIVAIDAVLNYEHHNYIFFCARETFDGQHNFAATLSQHRENANRYHKALDARNKAKSSASSEKK